MKSDQHLPELATCRACAAVQKMAGLVLFIVMGTVFAGAWLIPVALSTYAPVFTGAGFNTAAALSLAGLALLLPGWRRWMGWLIAAISAVVIVQYLFAWFPPSGFWRIVVNVGGNDLSWPGRMAPLSAFSLLCAGLALATLDRSRSLTGQILLQVAPGLILAATAGGVLNRGLDGLLFVVTLDRYTVMSLPTMVALCVFVAGYLAAMLETPWFRRFYAQHEERQVLAIGLAGFASALLIGGAATVALLGKQMQASVETELSSSAETQAAIIPLAVSSALSSLHAMAVSHQDLTALLRDLAGSGGSVWLEGAGDAAGLAAESSVESPIRLPVKDTNPAWLVWNGRWLLEVHFPAAQGHGTVVVQQPLPVLDSLIANNLTNRAETVEGMETLFCGRAGNEQMACFSSVRLPHFLLASMRHNGVRVPMWFALEGQQGLIVGPDYRGVLVVAAYRPVAGLGLGLVRKIDADKMYQSIRTVVWQAIAVMVGIGLLAAQLIYLRVRFVVQRAVESGRQLRGVLDALPVGVWLTDTSGRFILSNPAGRRIWAGERWIGIDRYGEYKGWWHDTGKRIEARDWALARAIEHGETSIDEIIDIECFDGNRKIISNSALPLRDEQGAITGAVVVNSDITAQMRADEEIRRLEREFHSLAENLPDIVSRFDSELRCIYVNPEIRKSLGMSRESLLGKTHAELDMPGNVAELWTNALRRVFFTGEPEVFEFGFTAKNGLVRYFQTRAVPECDASGKVGSVLTIARDISAIKGAEAVLRESERRLHSITSNVPGMVFQCFRRTSDDELQFTYISTGAEWLLGMDAGVIQQNGNVFISLIATDDARSFHESMSQSQANMSLWNWEGRLVTAEGELRWINLRATPRRYGEDVCMWDGVAINITLSKISEEKLIQAKDMLRDLSAHRENVREKERKRIAREIHDELGQLLTALRMDVSLARLGFGESNPQLLSRLQSMTQLVDRTIQTARHVTSSLRPGALDLGIVAALEWLVEEFIGYAGIPCELVLGDGDITLNELVATAVFRIIQESLTNIARHAAATQVEIIVTRTDARLCFEVRDNGKGFDPHAIASRKSFGLVGIRERVEMMEGDFELYSEPGRGTRIRVCVPVA